MSLFSETTFALAFILFLALFLWQRRHKVEVQKWVFPLLYMILYRMKWGIKTMDVLAKRYPRLVLWFAYGGVYVGFLGMILTVGYLGYMLFNVFFMGSTDASVAVVQPFVETDFGSPFFYVPFTYFIVAIFIIATVHEAAHGVVARLFKVKVKSTGFAFFSVLVPIIPAAFVEPDDKQVKKISPMKQLGIYAAGPFSNLLLALLVFIIMLAVTPGLNSVTSEHVVISDYVSGDDMYPAELAGVGVGERIRAIDDVAMGSVQDFVTFMGGTAAGQQIVLHTNASSYDIVLAESPGSETGYLGVMVRPLTEYDDAFKATYGWLIPPMEWMLGLMLLLFIFNIGVALINLAPIGPLDGGRMLLTVLLTRFPEKKALTIWGKVSLLTLLLLLANIFLPWILRAF